MEDGQEVPTSNDISENTENLMNVQDESETTENDESKRVDGDAENAMENGDTKKTEVETPEEETKPTETEEDYKCQPMFVCCCGASFQFLGQITSHKKKNCKWIYVCPHCDRVYENFDKMTEHKKTHQKPVEAPVETPVADEKTEVPLVKDDDKMKEEKPGEGSNLGVAKDNEEELKPKISDSGKVAKVELTPTQPKSKLLITPVEKKIPPHFRARVPNQMGNQMRPNMMPNQGMMGPQGYMGGFNQGMNYGMGMQPMMNMGMGMGQMNPGMNMGYGGFNMPNQFCGPNMGMGGPNMGMNMGGMGMNMGGMNMGMGGPNMGGMNQGPYMGGMNQGPNMGVMNPGPNMGGMNPVSNMGGMNQGPNMGGMNQGPNMGGMNQGPNMGGMNQGPNMGGMNQGSNMGGMNQGPNIGGMNQGPNMGGMNQGPNMGGMNMENSVGGNGMANPGFNPAPGSSIPGGSRSLHSDLSRDVKSKSQTRGRSISPPSRREDLRALSPVRRTIDKDNFRDFDRFDYRDDDPIDRLGLERSKWKDDRDRYSPDRGYSKRSMTRDEFLSSSASSSSFFNKSNPNNVFSKTDNLFDRNYSPRDDGPPGLTSKLGFSSNSKRNTSDPLISRPPKIMRSSDYH